MRKVTTIHSLRKILPIVAESFCSFGDRAESDDGDFLVVRCGSFSSGTSCMADMARNSDLGGLGAKMRWAARKGRART